MYFNLKDRFALFAFSQKYDNYYPNHPKVQRDLREAENRAGALDAVGAPSAEEIARLRGELTRMQGDELPALRAQLRENASKLAAAVSLKFGESNAPKQDTDLLIYVVGCRRGSRKSEDCKHFSSRGSESTCGRAPCSPSGGRCIGAYGNRSKTGVGLAGRTQPT